MKPGRRIRSAFALLALLGVLLAQLGLAAYACPFLKAPAHCDGMVMVDEAEPALCQAHSQQGDQSLDKPLAPAVPAPVFEAGLAVTHLPAPSPPPDPPSLLHRPIGPSAEVRHCRFLI